MRANPPFTSAGKAAATIAIALALVLSGSNVAANAAKPTKPPSDGGGGGTSSELAIPRSMAAAGDSISVATNHNLSCVIFTTCAAASWTTGTSTSVDSHFLRIKDSNRRITSRNAAFSGANMSNLNAQFSSIVAGGYKPSYVTVLIGANDLCGLSLTPTDTFRTQFNSALTNLYAASPDTSVFVGSIPDLKRLYDLMKNNSSALSVWDQYDVCPLMLTPGVDQAPVIQRQADFNLILQQVCASFVTVEKPHRCKFDGYAVTNTDFVATDVSTVDYFHPSAAGQKKLAAITWAASFWPTR